MDGSGELGVDSICCLLHNLVPGGSGRQWVHLLGRHVAAGGRATIVAPPGPLAEPARTAGIELVPCSWEDDGALYLELLRSVAGRHRFAVVQWDLGAMEAFEPVLESCGRAALAMHQLPQAPARWAGAGAMAAAALPVERALADPRASLLVRGESHRRRVAAAFGLPEAGMRILPASIPVETIPFQPQLGEPREVLALMRLSADKEAIVRLAVGLTRQRLAMRRPCRLTIAGEGEWEERTRELCAERLPPGTWQLEPAPRDPIARLADSDLVVAQGLTTLEAAAVGRRVVVARMPGADRAAAVVLTPDRYDAAARDPFGEPQLSEDCGRLWNEVLALDAGDLRRLRLLVEERNGLAVAARALGEAIAATAG